MNTEHAKQVLLLRRIPTFARRYGRHASLFLANFGAAKLVAFLGPLALARVLDPAAYGGIEFGLSVASMVAGVVSLGIPGALPQMTLLRRTMPLLDILAASVAAPGVPSLLVAIALLVYWGPETTIYALASVCTVLALAQGALSIYCRTFSLRNLAAWADGIGNLLVVAVGLAAYFLGRPTLHVIGVGLAACAVLVVAFAFAMAGRFREPALSERLSAAIRFGAPVLLQSLIIVWCVVSGRIYLGSFLDARSVALYGASFRIASALLLIHAALATALFAVLYAMRTRQYDLFLSWYFAFLTAVGIAMILGFPYVVANLSLRAFPSIPEAVALFPIVVLQVFAWGCSASIEARVARARRASSAAVGMTIMAAGFAIIMLAAARQGLLTIDGVAWLSALQVIACVLIQYCALWRKGLKLPRSMFAFILGAIFIGGLALTVDGASW